MGKDNDDMMAGSLVHQRVDQTDNVAESAKFLGMRRKSCYGGSEAKLLKTNGFPVRNARHSCHRMA
jgi:hypothetical protein